MPALKVCELSPFLDYVCFASSIYEKMVKNIFLNNKILVSSVVHEKERSRQDDKEQRIGVQSKIVCHGRVRFVSSKVILRWSKKKKFYGLVLNQL